MKRTASLIVTCLLTAGLFSAFAPPASARTQRANVRITTNKEFTKVNGVRRGDGSKAHPYVISGWDVQQLLISNTNKYVRILDNTVRVQMILDWVGNRVEVHYNTIEDLRVNRNVKRTGLPTSGHIEHNKFGVVGQLRHWDGHFVYNTVGTAQDLSGAFANPRGVNFDGFNGAHFNNNTIYGYVDARLHGHHHSSSFDATSHNHGSGHSGHKMDHSERYHQVFIHDNLIFTNHTYALAYLDTNHAGNDRTAASEENPDLNKPHVHHTRVYIQRNRLSGAGIFVNVFNSADPNHKKIGRGLMVIERNRISLADDGFMQNKELNGVRVFNAQNIDLRIVWNNVAGKKPSGDTLDQHDGSKMDAGVFLQNIDRGTARVANLKVTNRAFGVRAHQLTEKVTWIIDGLVTKNVGQRVYYDQTVKTKPR